MNYAFLVDEMATDLIQDVHQLDKVHHEFYPTKLPKLHSYYGRSQAIPACINTESE